MPELRAHMPLDAECQTCGHRFFEHAHDGCCVRQMYGARFPCECPAFALDQMEVGNVAS